MKKQTNTSRDEILERIATAPQRRSAYMDALADERIYKPIEPDTITCFCSELEQINGLCVVCENEADLYNRLKVFVNEQAIPSIFCRDNYITEQLNQYQIPVTCNESDFETMQAGITGCEFLIARTGSVVVSSASPSGRQLHVFPPIHIVLAHESQLVNYPRNAYDAIQEKYGDQLPGLITTITGPSRTADIEKTLVLGAHGPKVFVVFLCKD